MFTKGASTQEHIGLSFKFFVYIFFWGQAENFSPGSAVISLSDKMFLKTDTTLRLLTGLISCETRKQINIH